MQDFFNAITSSALFWIAALFGVVLWVLLRANPNGTKTHRDTPGWLKKNYWIVLIFAGLILATGAIYFYLYEIALIVNRLVDHLETRLQDPQTPVADLRHIGTTVALLLGAMAAAATLIFQLVRIYTTERQTVATETGLITDRINKAVQGLGAEKIVRKVIEQPQYLHDGDEWVRDDNGDPVPARRPDGLPLVKRESLETSEPNIEVRIGAIYALERIAAEDLSFHIQIMDILCAYIRHNAPASLAADDPDNLTEPRDDIQTALTVLGRRDAKQIAVERAVKTPDRKGHSLDLRKTCLQQVNLFNLNFELAVLEKAHMQGAYLGRVRLQGASLGAARLQQANLGWAQLQGADLEWAQLQGADLGGTQLQGANLKWAQLQGAILERAEIDETTSFNPYTFLGVGLKAVDFTHISKPIYLAEAFGDASVTLPESYKAGQGDLAHWSAEILEWEEFNTQWRAHRKSIGYTP